MPQKIVVYDRVTLRGVGSTRPSLALAQAKPWMLLCKRIRCTNGAKDQRLPDGIAYALDAGVHLPDKTHTEDKGSAVFMAQNVPGWV